MSQLFNIEAKEVEYIIEVSTYKNNKVFNKIAQLIKSGGIFKIKDLKLESEELKAYEVIGKIKGSRKEFIKAFISEIISYIPDNFSSNYSFDFTGEELGYTSSFIIYEMDEKNTKYVVSHRIKEIRKDGSSKAPVQQIKR
jgi:hypothetical protein